MILERKICGPKFSLCCSVVSVWGIVQLAITGLLYYFRAVAFTEDLFIPEMEHGEMTQEKFYQLADHAYQTTAINCGIAVLLYIISFLVSLHQFHVNRIIAERGPAPKPKRIVFKSFDSTIPSTSSLAPVASTRSLAPRYSDSSL